MADIDDVARSRLEDESEETALWPQASKYNLPEEKRLRNSWRQRRLACLNVAMLCLSLATLILAGVFRYGRTIQNKTNSLKRLLHTCPAPLLDKFDIALVNVQSSSFFDNSSIFRQLPSDEVDAAWKRIAPERGIYLTTDQIIKLGKDPTTTARSNEHPDLHIGILNGMHELHCLNLNRKNLHRDYYWPEGIRSPVLWIHLHHCVELLVQALTCTGNMDVITFQWMETQTAPFFDFSINRVCRDFDRILEWQAETLPDLERVHRMGGEKEVQASYLLQALNAQSAEDRVFTHDDPAFGGIGI